MRLAAFHKRSKCFLKWQTPRNCRMSWLAELWARLRNQNLTHECARDAHGYSYLRNYVITSNSGPAPQHSWHIYSAWRWHATNQHCHGNEHTWPEHDHTSVTWQTWWVATAWRQGLCLSNVHTGSHLSFFPIMNTICRPLPSRPPSRQ